MADVSENPIAGYIEAQMAGTAGIVQAALHGMQRVQEIMLRAMRDGTGEQLALARSVTQARDAADLTRAGEAHAGPAAEQVTRYQQEMIGAVTDMNTEMIQASYAMMERVGQALAASASAMGLPASGQASPMAAFQAGVRQWQGAMDQLTQAAGLADVDDVDAEQGAAEVETAGSAAERSRRRGTSRKSGRR